jgi:hypothetical protein
MIESSIYSYIALDNPDGAVEFISKKGLKPVMDYKGLASQLKQIVKAQGQPALDELVMQHHPDLEMFVSPKFNNYSGGCGKSTYSNGCGCEHSNANGTGQIAKAEVEKIINGQKQERNIDTIIIMGTVIIALALILNKK